MAREWQVPHSTLVRDWTGKDLRLAMADLIARDDIGECGQPHSLSTQPGAIDRYRVETDRVCGACARLAEHRKAHPDLPPGTLERLIDVTAGTDSHRGAGEDTAFGPTFD